MTLRNMHIGLHSHWHVKARPNGGYFADDFFKMHFFVWKLLYCDLNFTEVYPKVPINDKSTMLVQIMAPLLTLLEPHFIINNAVDGQVPLGARTSSGHGDGCKCGSLQQYKHDYVIWISHVTVTPHEHHGVSSHGHLDCSFNRLPRPNK